MEKEKTSEEFKKELLLDSLFQLECADAYLSEDIDFLNCIDEQYFNGEQKEYPEYLYWQLGAIIRTLRKSLECTQMKIQESVKAVYEEKKKVGVTNADNK